MENYEYKYQGRDAVPDIIEAGEYVVEVIEAVLGVSNGAKTAGSRTLNLKLKEMESGATIWETLTEHPSIDFRIDTFIRCTGIKAELNKPFSLTPRICVGRRGHVIVSVDNWNNKDRNRIAVWRTDAEILDRVAAPQETPEPDADPFGADDDVPF